ncbi:hypothetical protein GUITHDRAFT_91235 [Guillardia theta CCMP2712]|uniref:Protein kinase domain-containing protein n=1 Tax=Guillardia theta (strain CCMP2712) TaxID=905079 RepID=L1I4U0_GUITC|nr:hypothetical protein GUITHDRAFT_91235 [Guillardia theta CCMP2712]EKX31268.1 hypothetical protein GUITHDRAFT_91235 [Guillardia theta CCMP2712]|eukprot:XP_005818248.1 hypothetical protein GUITHDRAFT_91235 [Guillardia theta CCMP2712]
MYGYQAGGAYFPLSPSTAYKTANGGQTQNAKDYSTVASPKNIEVMDDRIRTRVANPVPPVKIVPTPTQDSGHFVGYVGDSINRSKDFPSGRYIIKRKLGAGTYGKVLECTDKKYNLPVAVKIVRRDPPIYKEAAKKEIKVLRYLGGTHGLVKLLRDFVHDGHICMSLEMYGDNIQHYMRRNKKPFKIQEIKDIGLQIVHATCYMHNKGVIHTDIKAENILLAHGPDGAVTIKVVDLGSAIFVNDWHPPVIGTLEYRAPEIILQAAWSYPVDMYAIGCVLAELCIGDFLFPACNEAEYLSVISFVTENSFPPDLIRQGKASAKYRLRSDCTRPVRSLSAGSRVKKVLSDMIYDAQLLSLLEDMLAFDPNLRINATDAKKHPFFFDR